MSLRRVLVLAGLLAVGWAVVRVGALWAGADWVVGDDDPHGYFAIFSLLLLPFLAAAAVLLAVDARSGRGGRAWSGVALTLSAPLADPLAIPVAAVGVAIVVVAVVDIRGDRPGT